MADEFAALLLVGRGRVEDGGPAEVQAEVQAVLQTPGYASHLSASSSPGGRNPACEDRELRR